MIPWLEDCLEEGMSVSWFIVDFCAQTPETTIPYCKKACVSKKEICSWRISYFNSMDEWWVLMILEKA